VSRSLPSEMASATMAMRRTPFSADVGLAVPMVVLVAARGRGPRELCPVNWGGVLWTD